MLKLFLMTKNEMELLGDWLDYHTKLFGANNIYVLDGSDDPRIFGIYDVYKREGLNVIHSRTGLNGLEDELTQLMHDNKGIGNFLIKLDTDEFLAYSDRLKAAESGLLQTGLRRMYHAGKLTRRLAEPLLNRLHRNDQPQVDDFAQFFAKLPVTGQRYKASLTAWSIPRQKSLSRAARELVDFTPLQFTQFKTFFHSDSFVRVDLGGHVGVSKQNDGVIETGLIVLHYHSTSVDDSARRARQVLVSHDYIHRNDSIAQQRAKLSAVRSHGEVASFHKIDFYLQYLDALEGGRPLDPSVLNRQHPYFRETGAPRQMTLVRDTLNAIDQARATVQ